MKSDSRGHTRWFIKCVSLSIIFFFLTTQTDLRLASASLISVPLPPPKISDHIHYQNDLDSIVNQDPLATGQEATPDQAGKTPEQLKLAEKPINDILSDINPLSSSHEGETPVITSAKNSKDQTIITWK